MKRTEIKYILLMDADEQSITVNGCIKGDVDSENNLKESHLNY